MFHKGVELIYSGVLFNLVDFFLKAFKVYYYLLQFVFQFPSSSGFFLYMFVTWVGYF